MRAARVLAFVGVAALYLASSWLVEALWAPGRDLLFVLAGWVWLVAAVGFGAPLLLWLFTRR